MKPKISEKAKSRVLDQLDPPTVCPNCLSGSIALVTNDVVYGKTYGNWSWIYLCHNCRSYVGTHPQTDIPLGYLANKETRIARQENKPVFEKLFKNKSNGLTRTEAYRRLAEFLGLARSQCHFGMFTVAQCEQVPKAVKYIIAEQHYLKYSRR